MDHVKAAILAKLDNIHKKAQTKTVTTQIATLNAYHVEGDVSFSLSVEISVEKDIYQAKIKIDRFTIESIHLIKNDGQDPGFKFSNAEIENHIKKSLNNY